jgi:hypothetical protein
LEIKWFQIWNKITDVESPPYMHQFGHKIIELFMFVVVKTIFSEIPSCEQHLCHDIQDSFV